MDFEKIGIVFGVTALCFLESKVNQKKRNHPLLVEELCLFLHNVHDEETYSEKEWVWATTETSDTLTWVLRKSHKKLYQAVYHKVTRVFQEEKQYQTQFKKDHWLMVDSLLHQKMKKTVENRQIIKEKIEKEKQQKDEKWILELERHLRIGN